LILVHMYKYNTFTSWICYNTNLQFVPDFLVSTSRFQKGQIRAEPRPTHPPNSQTTHPWQ
jgi:hypothetical protein